MSDKNTNKNNEDNSIRIFGLDGLLIAVLIGLCVVGVLALKFKMDILMGYVFPLTLLAIVLGVSINYAMTLGGFIKMQKEQFAAKEAAKTKE